MSFTPISSSRCSTPITMSAGSCRSTFTTRRRADRSPCCCAPARRPRAFEVRGHLRRLVRRTRKHWPATRITIRGDSHYGRPEVMEWCDENGIDFIFGLAGNAVLDRLVDEAADDIRTRRALDQKPCLRGFAETSYRQNPGTPTAAPALGSRPPPRASTFASS